MLPPNGLGGAVYPLGWRTTRTDVPDSNWGRQLAASPPPPEGAARTFDLCSGAGKSAGQGDARPGCATAVGGFATGSRLSATPGGGSATGLGVVLGMFDDNDTPGGDPIGWEITD